MSDKSCNYPFDSDQMQSLNVNEHQGEPNTTNHLAIISQDQGHPQGIVTGGLSPHRDQHIHDNLEEEQHQRCADNIGFSIGQNNYLRSPSRSYELTHQASEFQHDGFYDFSKPFFFLQQGDSEQVEKNHEFDHLRDILMGSEQQHQQLQQHFEVNYPSLEARKNEIQFEEGMQYHDETQQQQQSLVCQLKNQSKNEDNIMFRTNYEHQYEDRQQDHSDDAKQTQRMEEEQIKQEILSNEELKKKYAKLTCCPICQLSNLQSYEINKEQSIYMCANKQCSFPIEDPDLEEYTFPTKFKKRNIKRLQKKISNTFGESATQAVFEEIDKTWAKTQIQSRLCRQQD